MRKGLWSVKRLHGPFVAAVELCEAAFGDAIVASLMPAGI